MTLLPIHFIPGGIVIEETEVTIADIARYILEKCGQMTTMKLQKLCYYSQVWHCYHLEKKLFKEDIQAWSYGPVSYDLFELHRGKYEVSAAEIPVASPHALDQVSIALIDQVLESYAPLTGAQLSDLSHAESPWLITRGLVTGSSQSPTISVNAMYEFAASASAGR